jgi:hypothetical protein
MQRWYGVSSSKPAVMIADRSVTASMVSRVTVHDLHISLRSVNQRVV